MSEANEESPSTDRTIRLVATNPLPEGTPGPDLLVDLMTERAIYGCGIKENWEEPGGWEYDDPLRHVAQQDDRVAGSELVHVGNIQHARLGHFHGGQVSWTGGDGMSLNISLLKNVVRRDDGSIVAQCPACAAQGEDQTGRNHLIVFPNGRYGCAIYPLDHEGFGSEERKKHLRKIHQLVGMPFDDEMGGVGGHFRNTRPRYVKRKPVAAFR